MTERTEASGTLYRMPQISRFLGIAIKMYYKEHAPPHFHAIYGEYEVSIEVQSGLVRGSFPSRELRHVLEWAELHKPELATNWDRARRGEPLMPIVPLE